jgi:hypothetical protein
MYSLNYFSIEMQKYCQFMEIVKMSPQKITTNLLVPFQGSEMHNQK